MSLPRIIALVSLTVVALITTSTPAQTDSTDPTGAEAAFAPVRNEFVNLYRSLQARRGLKENDRPVVESVRDQVHAFNEQWPDYAPALAVEAQLARWLQDDEAVGLLYRRLVTLDPDNAAITLSLAQYLASRQNYVEAISVLGSNPPDPSDEPKIVRQWSDWLFAENRFEESLQILDSIPQEAIESDATLALQIEQLRSTREQYVDFWATEREIRQTETMKDDLPRVKLETTKGTIIVELFEDHAPNSVANFLSLVDSGFYNLTKFHRVVGNTMIQGGDPNSKPGALGIVGQGNPGYFIADEFGGEDDRVHFAGTLAMANLGTPNSTGCQFYITRIPSAGRNGRHAVFGIVIEGLDVVRAIEKDDAVESAVVLRKRDHEYVPVKAFGGAESDSASDDAQPDQAPAVLRGGDLLGDG